MFVLKPGRDANQEAEILTWIEGVLGEKLPSQS